MMAPKAKKLTREEFASLLKVADSSAVLEPPAVIPAENSTRLIGLGYMVDLGGRLRMRTAGRHRIAEAEKPKQVRTQNSQLRRPHSFVRFSAFCTSLIHSPTTFNHASLSSGFIALSACWRASSAYLQILVTSSISPENTRSRSAQLLSERWRFC